MMALLPAHSADEEQIMEPVQQDLCFEGFLRKRKDTMKFTWAKYWFRLQNTTLYFYTTRNGQPACLRGQYYMYWVQSVRSVTSPDGDFTFEIVMKNGKKKLLSADSKDLRDVWIKLLWKSMQLPGPGHASSSCTWFDIPELVQRGHSASSDGMSGDWTPNDDLSKTVVQSAALQSGGAPAIDNYDVPKPTKAVQALSSGSEGDAAPDSNIYDIPRPMVRPSTPPSAAPDHPCDDETGDSSAGGELQYLAMDIYDTLVPASRRLTGSSQTGTSNA